MVRNMSDNQEGTNEGARALSVPPNVEMEELAVECGAGCFCLKCIEDFLVPNHGDSDCGQSDAWEEGIIPRLTLLLTLCVDPTVIK